MTNEKRLIDANDLNKYKVTGEIGNISGDFIPGFAVDIIPTVDAVEVVHGYWIDSTTVDHMGRVTEYGIDCSVCNSVFKDDSREVVNHWKEQFEVCPFCGTKMDLEDNYE